MTKKLLTDRVDETANISAGPDTINLIEVDVADLIGFDTEQLYADSPFSFDSDGNITSARAGDSLQTIFTGAAGAAGIRIWDTSNLKEVLISMENDEFIIYENRTVADGGTGVLGGTGNWKERFNVALTADSGDTAGQDILNHLRMPTSISDGEYLRGNTTADTIEWASFDAATPDSCSVHSNDVVIADCSSWGVWRNISAVDGSFHVEEDWDNADMLYNTAGTYDYIEIQSDGIYSLHARCSIDQSQTGATNGYRGVGYSTVTALTALQTDRAAAFTSASGHQIFTATWIVELSAADKIYPKLHQSNSGNLELQMTTTFSVTKISQVS